MVYIGRNRNGPLQDKLTKWASSKIHMVELQEDLLRKELDLKLQLIKSHHQHIIETEKKESDIIIELLKQKHAKDMEFLDLKIENFKSHLKLKSF